MYMDFLTKHNSILMVIVSLFNSLAFGQSGGGQAPVPICARQATGTFERWANNRYLMGRQVIIMTDNPSHVLVVSIQQIIPAVIVMSPAEALNFVDTQRQMPLIILIGSEVWRQNHYDRLSIYIAGGGDRVMPVLLQGQSAETSLPIFLRDYFPVRLTPDLADARLLADQIVRAIAVPNNTNASVNTGKGA